MMPEGTGPPPSSYILTQLQGFAETQLLEHPASKDAAAAGSELPAPLEHVTATTKAASAAAIAVECEPDVDVTATLHERSDGYSASQKRLPQKQFPRHGSAAAGSQDTPAAGGGQLNPPSS